MALLGLLMPSASSSAECVAGDSRPRFAPYDVGLGMSYLYGKTIFDIDADGLPEIVFADSLSDARTFTRDEGATLYAFGRSGLRRLAREDMSWHPRVADAGASFDGHALVERMVHVDVDDDGLDDVVAAVNSHDAVVAYLNPGPSGGAWARRVLTMETPGAINLLVADVDGDGRPDIVVSMRDQGQVWPASKPGIGWLRNEGGGAWRYGDIDVGDPWRDVRTLVALDRGDGDAHAVVAIDRLETAQAHLIRWRDEGFARTPIPQIDTNGSHFFHGHAVVDGTRQVVFAQSTLRAVEEPAPDGAEDAMRPAHRPATVLFAAAFPPERLEPVVTEPVVTELAVLDASATVAEIAGGDLTGDGVEEIVVATLDRGILYLQEEGEAWAVRHVTRLPANYHSVALADMDGDGRLDVVTTIEYPSRYSDSANVVRVFQNVAAEPCG